MAEPVTKPDENYHIGHRQRLRDKFVRTELADHELLELMLCYAIPRCDTRRQAHRLLEKYGGIYQILSAPLESLESVPGMGESSAILFKAAHQAMIRGYRHILSENSIYYDEKALLNYCRLEVGGLPVEELHILYLNQENFLLLDDKHSTGTIDESAVYPREIIKIALELEARKIVMVHNHPTPGKSFSRPDIDMTLRLQPILANIGIELVDHYVVSGGIVYSARASFLK